MQEERQVAGPAGRARQSLALAGLLVPARGTGNCKQSKNSASDLRCATWRTTSQKSSRSTPGGSMSVHTKLERKCAPATRMYRRLTAGAFAAAETAATRTPPVCLPGADTTRRSNRSYPHPLSAGSSNGGIQEERQVAGPADRVRQSLALARLLVPARGVFLLGAAGADVLFMR
jgi:hypothetical protein